MTRKSYTVQERRVNGGWTTLKSYRSEATALDICASFGENSPRQTFRVVELADRGIPARVIGMRAPAVANDLHLHR